MLTAGITSSLPHNADYHIGHNSIRSDPQGAGRVLLYESGSATPDAGVAVCHIRANLLLMELL